MADLGGAMSAAGAILAALIRRERNGQGGWIDAALLDAALFAGVMLRAGALEGGTPPDLKREVLSGGLACYHLYRTGDGRAMALGALEPKFFAAFCTLAGRPDLIPHQLDPARQDWLKAELGALFAGKTQAEWAALIAAGGADSCCTPVLNILEAADDPSVRGRGLWFEDEQGTGHTRTVPPIR
jgi:crotonobetainyl-CoA:carnitine CoA-transferase CaiB-like acyl-CoA transferase